MSKDTRFVGMDVHADTIAVAEGRDRVRSLGIVPNRPEAIRRLLGKVGKLASLRVCYEAGPTGYALYWQLTKLGVHCDVIAPSLVPTKSGERVKTDRRDAEKLARSYRSGDLTPVWVPDSKHEAIRDLVRAREAAKEDRLRAKHRLSKYLLRYGQRAPDGCRAWTAVWWQWVRGLELTSRAKHDAGRVGSRGRSSSATYRASRWCHRSRRQRSSRAAARSGRCAPSAARSSQDHRGDAGDRVRQLQPLRASNPSHELHGHGSLRAFEWTAQSSGRDHQNRQLPPASGTRRSGWHYRHRPKLNLRQKELQPSLAPKVAAVAWRAQERLHRRYWALANKSKPTGGIVTAVARELAGFVWAIGVETEKQLATVKAAGTSQRAEVNESAAERGYGGGSSRTLCGQTHEPSARQLPTNHDHEGGCGRPSNISVINRRIQPTSAADSFASEINERIRSDLTRSSVLAGSCHINVLAFSCERQQQRNRMLPRQQARGPRRTHRTMLGAKARARNTITFPSARRRSSAATPLLGSREPEATFDAVRAGSAAIDRSGTSFLHIPDQMFPLSRRRPSSPLSSGTRTGRMASEYRSRRGSTPVCSHQTCVARAAGLCRT